MHILDLLSFSIHRYTHHLCITFIYYWGNIFINYLYIATSYSLIIHVSHLYIIYVSHLISCIILIFVIYTSFSFLIPRHTCLLFIYYTYVSFMCYILNFYLCINHIAWSFFDYSFSLICIKFYIILSEYFIIVRYTNSLLLAHTVIL